VPGKCEPSLPAVGGEEQMDGAVVYLSSIGEILIDNLTSG
jgi:hypothetical protein